MPDFPLHFIDHQPPAGGLHRLQQSLTEPAAARDRWTPRLLGTGAFAVVIWVLCLMPGWWAQQQQQQRLNAVVQQAFSSPDKAIEVTDGAAIALPSGQSNVRLYLVQSLPPPAPTEHATR